MDNQQAQIACGGLIIQDKKILLIKRSNYTSAFPGYWAFPGGRKDPDETLEQGVIREVKEEVNLDFQPTSLFSSSIWNDRNFYRFLGDFAGEIKIQTEEIDASGWYTFKEANKLDLAFDCKEIINKLNKNGII